MFGRMMASAIALTSAAYAQTPGDAAPGCAPQPTCSVTPPANAADRVVYEAAAFAQYNPQTALDMVRQTPGFSLDDGDGRRGFSGAVGNVLIDGVRPSAKSQSLDGILSRIPANQVVRLEVLRGSAVAGDASGQATLLNVVRTESAGSGVYSAGFEHGTRGVYAPQGEINYSGRSGNVEYGLGVSVYSQYRSLPGWRRFYAGPDETYDGRADTPSPRDFREASITGNLAFPLAGGRLSLNGQTDSFRFHADNQLYFFDAANAASQTVIQDYEERRPTPRYEIGANYDRDFGPWSLALVGLLNRRTYENEENGVFYDGLGAVTSSYSQNVNQEAGETIARATLSGPLSPRQRIEFGGEIAFNTLDQELAFVSDPPSPPIPNSNVLVEEERGEAFVSHTWQPADLWSLETRLAWETSTLTFTGDTNQTVELSYWKPSVQLSRTFGGNDQIRARIYRDVGQLDFGDFVSAADVTNALINGGNPDLAPQTSWIAELGADFRFDGGAALGLTLSRRMISDVADVVKIVDDAGTPSPADDIIYDAPGNIGDGEITQFDVNFSSPVPFIPGSRLTVEGFLRDSEVTDPVTGRPRIISYTPESYVNVSFRQDLSDWRFAWGFEATKQGETQGFRYNETDTEEEGPYVDAFIETTALPNNMKLRLTAANIFSGTINRDRRFFAAPDRSSGAFAYRDLRQREFKAAPWFIVVLSGTF
ncbi:MAG: TonB-dependent receptor [Hyphomonadaceae bacterium]